MGVPTRDRIVVESMRLFAERGFAATSITAIEDAAGLAVGGGGVYKHFPSKQAILEEGIRRYEESQERAMVIDERFERLPLHDALVFVARFGLAQLAGQRELIKVLFREMDPYPDLMASLRERYIQRTYAFVGEWLAQRRAAGQVRADLDADAVAVIAVGAMVNYRVLETFFGEPPGAVDEERFVAAWVDLVERAIA